MSDRKLISRAVADLIYALHHLRLIQEVDVSEISRDIKNSVGKLIDVATGMMDKKENPSEEGRA